MSTQNKRAHARVSVSIPVTIELAEKPGSVIEAQVMNLSFEGAYLQCQTSIPVGKEITIRIAFSETRLLRAKVVDDIEYSIEPYPSADPTRSLVKWSKQDTHSSIGIQFLDLKEDRREFVERLLGYYQSLSKAGVSFED